MYWFYTAQLRSKVFSGILDQAKTGGMGSKEFELTHAQNSFFQLAGPNINGYAFGNPEKLSETIKQVMKEKDNFPDLGEIYSNVSFIPARNRQSVVDEVSGGLSGLITYLETNKDSLKEQRVENGTHELFGNLKRK